MGNLQLGAEDRATLAGDDNFEDFPLKGPPRSGVIQSAGKELDPASPKFIPGAQAGLIGLRFSRDESKAVRNFNFIPFATEPTFNVYEPSVGTVQGGLVNSFKQRPREARWQTDANGRRRCMLPDGNIVKESRLVYMVVGGRIIAFEAHSSGLTPIYDMLDRCGRFSATLPGETKPTRAPFVSKWCMGVTERREGQFRWFMPNPELIGKLGEPSGPTIDEVRFAQQVRALFLTDWVGLDELMAAVEAPRAARLQEVTSGPAPKPIETAPSNPGRGNPVDDDIPF